VLREDEDKPIEEMRRQTMKSIKMPMIAWLILGVVMLGSSFSPAMAAREAPRMSIDELKGMLGSKDLVVIDARAGKDWSSSELKIKTSVREEPKDFDSWAGKYSKDKKIVIYCA
jgi:predicted sulfurtransferase